MIARKFNRRPAGWAAVLAAVCLAAAAGAQARSRCAFPEPPTILTQEGDAHAKGARLLQVWEFPDSPVWWSQRAPKGYAAFRAQAARRVGDTDPQRLLAGAPSINNAIVAQAAAAWIRPINCLEMLLFQAQDRRLPTFEAPTEFLSFVLRSPDGTRLRAYFYTRNEDGIGRATTASEPAERDRKAGWTVLAGLHNHNFHPGRPDLNGPLAPSLPDAKFNANFAASAGMAEAWITNGLHTAHIPAAAFGRFERDP